MDRTQGVALYDFVHLSVALSCLSDSETSNKWTVDVYVDAWQKVEVS
jgi:hypothetical protein